MPWVPITGECVVESGPDDEPISGPVVSGGPRTALVQWVGSPMPEVWRNSQLEPGWD